LHVLMVGTFTTNAFVGRLGSEPAVFWCLEWFSNPEAARVLVAHETTHAFHQELLAAAPPDTHLPWTCLFEGSALEASSEARPAGLAVRASRSSSPPAPRTPRRQASGPGAGVGVDRRVAADHSLPEVDVRLLDVPPPQGPRGHAQPCKLNSRGDPEGRVLVAH